LVDTLGAANVFIVSKAAKKTADGSVACMEQAQFFEKTGFCRDNIRFCTKRNGSKGKWPIIMRELELDAFVDDNWSLFCDPLVEELQRPAAVAAATNNEKGSSSSSCAKVGGGSGASSGEGAGSAAGDAAAGGAQNEGRQTGFRCVFFDADGKMKGDADEAEGTQLDRDSEDKKANRNEKKCPFACGKEEYYREWTLLELVKLPSRDVRHVQSWEEIMKALLE